MTEHTTTLKRTLGSFRLWGIAVGLVISGEYFGWSYGWSQAGTMGFMVVARRSPPCTAPLFSALPS